MQTGYKMRTPKKKNELSSYVIPDVNEFESTQKRVRIEALDFDFIFSHGNILKMISYLASHT